MLTNLSIKDFKSIKEKSIPKLSSLTFVTGENGAGKSSLLEAICYLYTGELPDKAVRDGAKELTVSAQLGADTIQRSFGSKTVCRVNGATTTQKSVATLIESTTGVTQDVYHVLTSKDVLTRMTAGSLAEFLIENKLIPVGIDLDTLKVLCPTLTSAAEEELSHHLPPTPNKFGVEDIAAAYDVAFANRKAVKQVIAAKTIEATWEGPVPTRTLESIEAELKKFIAFDTEKASYQKLLEAYERIVAQRKSQLENIADLEKRINALGTLPTVDVKEGEFLKAQAEKLRNQLSQIDSTNRVFSDNICMFRKTLEDLDKPICPISKKLVCSTDKTAVKSELAKLLDDNVAELEKSSQLRSQIAENIKAVQAKLRAWEEARERLYKAEKLYEQHKTLKGALISIPEKPIAPTSSLDVTEKQRLIAEREKVFKYQNCLKAKGELKKLNAELDVWEELVAVLSPKAGIREAVIKIALEPLVEHINKRAAELKVDFAVDLKFENGVKIYCSPKKGLSMLPLEAVSSGEQAYALFLIMDALNELSGARILLLDDLDKLDVASFEALIGLCSRKDILDKYDHIMVAFVNHDEAVRVAEAACSRVGGESEIIAL